MDADEARAKLEQELAEEFEQHVIGMVSGSDALDAVREATEQLWGEPCVAQFEPNGSITVTPAFRWWVIAQG